MNLTPSSVALKATICQFSHTCNKSILLTKLLHSALDDADINVLQQKDTKTWKPECSNMYKIVIKLSKK